MVEHRATPVYKGSLPRKAHKLEERGLAPSSNTPSVNSHHVKMAIKLRFTFPLLLLIFWAHLCLIIMKLLKSDTKICSSSSVFALVRRRLTKSKLQYFIKKWFKNKAQLYWDLKLLFYTFPGSFFWQNLYYKSIFRFEAMIPY